MESWSGLPIKGKNGESWKCTSNKILSFLKNIVVFILLNKK